MSSRLRDSEQSAQLLVTRAHSSAVRDFREARRRADMERILARLRGRSADLLCFQEVTDLLKAWVHGEAGVQQIPLSAVVGSVGRCTDYTRSFLPIRDSDEERWSGVKDSLDTWLTKPSIQLYEVGGIYFVLDGHHRVSVARLLGIKQLAASVIKVPARVRLAPDIQPDDFAPKARYADFLEHTHLGEALPEADLSLSRTGGYQALERQIEAQRLALSLDQQHKVSTREAAIAWYSQVYLPLVRTLDERGMLQGMPQHSAAELFLQTCEHRASMGEELGWEVDLELAAADLVRRSATRPHQTVTRAGERLLGAVTPARLQTGPVPGTWRQEHHVSPQADCLFSNILVPCNGTEADWAAVAQAADIACREGAKVQGLHVASSGAKATRDQIQEMKADFARHCKEHGVAGSLTFEAGSVSHQVRERSRGADLIVMGLAHPPAPQVVARLNSQFCAVVRRCATPVLAVTGAPSPLRRPLLAYDGGAKAREALLVSAYMALQAGLPLVVVAVEEDSVSASEAVKDARAYLQRWGVQATYCLETGPTAGAILRTAEEYESDLILMGGYGHSPIVEVMLGSTLDEVLTSSRQPVFIGR